MSMYDKQGIYNFLKQKNIEYELTEHQAVYNMGDLPKVNMPYPDAESKNLFVRDDKKQNYYLITVRGNKRVDLKRFRKQHNTRALSFASENDLMEIMGLKPGSVSPFGLLNDNEQKVKFYIDKSFFSDKHIIGIHPNENTATVWLKVEDLISIIKDHGNQVFITEL